MTQLQSLRQLYRPIQPSIGETGGNILYKEVAPTPTLQGLIYCYWELRTNSQLDSPYVYRVVADGCIDVFFRLDDASDNYIMGFCRQYNEFSLGHSFHYMGVRFMPGAFPALFGNVAHELSNRFEPLVAVNKKLSVFISNNFTPNDAFHAIASRLDFFFISALHEQKATIDARFYNALTIILKSCGQLSIQTELQTGLSQRQLRRYFKRYIGESPNTFSKVIRFQKFLNTNPANKMCQNNQHYLDFGYYDQAHFIKEFKRLYGLSPHVALNR